MKMFARVCLVVAWASRCDGVQIQHESTLRGSKVQPHAAPKHETHAASQLKPVVNMPLDVFGHDGVNVTHLMREQLDGKHKDHNNTATSHIAANGTAHAKVDLTDFASYVACFSNPITCAVNIPKLVMELGNRVILFFGCSIDIYAVDYFCKAANQQMQGFTRAPGNTVFAEGNFAYCKIDGLVLAYSFHPGASGPPYFEACDKVLKGSCANVRPVNLIQQSVAKVVATFGQPPAAIVVDSSLWDAASWYIQDGKPPEPYIAPPTHLSKWCQSEMPGLVHAVQMASPTSKVAFRSAPRVEFMKGYGHTMENIDRMNQCFVASSVGSLMLYKMIDYSYIVEMFLARQGGPASNFYEDAFHPGLLPSVIYVDWVLQWAKTLPPGR